MTTVSNSYGAAPVYGAQQAYGPQPVQYSPGISTPYAADQYRPAQQTSGGGGLFGGQKRQLVTRESVITAAAGAGVGFLIGGPWGALIGGLIGLLFSVFSNWSKSKEAEKQQQQPIPANNANFTPQQTANDAYYQRMQQQQMQQIQQGG
jgi:hypothetical protein